MRPAEVGRNCGWRNARRSWNAKPENRHLPSALEWANIRLLTKKKDWTDPQRKMMKRAGRVHGVRGLTLATVLVLLGWGGYEVNGRVESPDVAGQTPGFPSVRMSQASLPNSNPTGDGSIRC